MKKYFIVSIIANIVLSFVAMYGLLNYLVISASKSYSSMQDTFILLSIVIIDILLNYIIIKVISKKTELNKILILVPSSVFMLTTGILFFFVR